MTLDSASRRVATMNTNNAAPTRRTHERIAAKLPVRLDDQLGITRDVSVGGVYFELDISLAIASEVQFDIDITTPQGMMKLTCSGRVVRAEQHGNRTGVAVAMKDARLEIV